MTAISRRDFVALTAVTAGSGLERLVFSRSGHVIRAAAPVTAQDIVDRIKANIGVEWRDDGVDAFKAGDPHVRGIPFQTLARKPLSDTSEQKRLRCRTLQFKVR